MLATTAARTRLLSARALAAVLAGACATARPGHARLDAAPSRGPNAATAPLAAAQLDSAAAGGSLLDALGRLRPEVLRPRAPSLAAAEGQRPAVYLDGMPHGDVSVLATIPARFVERVQYLRPSETGARLGRDYPGGAIVVTTRHAP